MKTLLLWDIDGTLIFTGGAGERALVAALAAEFGIRDSIADIELAGRTDRWIARRVFAKYSIPDTAENLARYLAAYLRALPTAIQNPQARTLPGIRELLAATAHRREVVHGLLTGNLRHGARIKLLPHDLWEPFSTGAFADDSEHRDDLGVHALRRAREYHATDFPLDRVWVIGDTPHDIACGQTIGARTLAVATGRYTLAQLTAKNPTAVFADLSDTAAVLRTLGL